MSPARGCSCEGSRMKSEGFWMAVVGSKGVGAAAEVPAAGEASKWS